jgi:hypothetical protein
MMNEAAEPEQGVNQRTVYGIAFFLFRSYKPMMTSVHLFQATDQPVPGEDI